MSKAATDRFDEALKTLEDFCAQRQSPGAYYAVLNWLKKQAHPATAKATVGALLSLDTHGPAPADRKLGRAFLLVSATCDGKSAVQVDQLRKELLATPSGAFSAVVQTRLASAIARHPLLSGSAVFEKSLLDKIGLLQFDKQKIHDAFETTKGLLRKAKSLLDARQCDAAYTRWFGAMDDARYQAVTMNIGRLVIASHTRPVVFEYLGKSDFGSSRTLDFKGYTREGIARIALGDKFFGPGADRQPRNAARNVAPAMMQMKGLNDEKDRAVKDTMLRVAALDDPNARRLADAEGAQKEAEINGRRAALAAASLKDDSVIGYAGICVHELSHNVVSTDDVVYQGVTMYGYNLCQYLAANEPKRALINADNYRLFCDEFSPF
ncbi:M35 family metallo-endopeptidase [Polyangium sp. 6x1]|uniref:M35 family metallo-endopeptidase n=1 Tax=Polyangium sp. 6x1 TaxID=3042689 RepID=UPI0024829A0A|nr:M35 family metallo-endopeptidase [Polyangium sp. 6x1]MDI1443446.1 M35 family metallo-endopeptidase [Polyangium sp. 6x1]